MKKYLIFALSLLMFTSTYVYATQEHPEPPPYSGSLEFQKIKSLAGTWKGTHEMEGKPAEEMTAEYSVESNGNAVVEKLSPGTPREMVSVYYDKGGKLAMTHYCAIGNRPEMKLISSNDKEIKLDFDGPSDIDASKDAHIHSLDLTFGDNQLTQSWTYYENGVVKGKTVIDLKRAS